MARHVLDKRMVPVLLLTFTVGFTLVFYSNQAKQYAGDVAAALLALWLTLHLRAAIFPLPLAPVRPANEICWSCSSPQVIGGNYY